MRNEDARAAGRINNINNLKSDHQLRWFGTQILKMGEYGKGPHCVVCNFHVTVS